MPKLTWKDLHSYPILFSYGIRNNVRFEDDKENGKDGIMNLDWDSQSLYTAAILENGGPMEHPPGAVRRFGGLRMESV